MPLLKRQDRLVLFIHIPKTGGTNITHLFATSGWSVYGDNETLPSWAANALRVTPSHVHADLLQEVVDLRRVDLVFTVVRNPFARFSSECAWRNPGAAMTVEDVTDWGNMMLDAYELDNSAYDNHMRPQTHFLPAQCTILRHEDGLQSGLHLLSTEYGLGLDATLLKSTRRGVPKHSWTSEQVPLSARLVSRIQRIYAQDFDKLSYSRENW